jgi:hypothetical protein
MMKREGRTMKNAVELTTGIVIAKSDILNATTAEISTFINDAILDQNPVMVVDSIQQFFSAKNLDKAIQDGDVTSIRMIAEKRGFEVTQDELIRIVNFKSFRTELAARERSIPLKYEFAEVPAGWTVDNELSITKRGVYRKKGSSGYTIGIKTLENLWNAASKVWSNDADAVNAIDVRASGYTHTASIGSKDITIGCQTIKRFELEQLAVNQGWKIPA